MTRVQLRNVIKKNLEVAGTSFYNDTELNDSIQDAYDDIVVLTQCIVKSATINWVSKNYYDFKADHAITDYLGTIAIFNNNTNMWLRDDVAYRQLDSIRADWENWRGNQQFWCPVAPNRIVTAPFNSPATGNFSLRYCATAPTLTDDADTFLIAADMQGLLERYVTGDMLETAEEFNKAGFEWKQYFEDVLAYKDRCHNLARSDLLLRV